MIKSFILIITMVTLSSCASTQKANPTHKPDDYVYVFSNGIDPEPELIKSGAKYYCEKVVYSSTGLNKACYIEKPKVREFSNALLKIPVVLGKVTLGVLFAVLNSGFIIN